MQVQHYLAVCGMNKAYIAALIGGNKFVFTTIYRDDFLIEELTAREKKFWEECVLTDTEPVADDSEATQEYLNTKYSNSVASTIQLNVDMKKVIAEYQDVDSKVKELEKKKTGLANQIKAVMGAYETGELDGIVVSWKKISRESVDGRRLRKEKPEIFAEYSNVSSYRKLSVA